MDHQPVRFCWMSANAAHPDRLARQTEQLKERVTKHVMMPAAERGFPLRTLVSALLESAASAVASGIVLDQAQRVLCSKTDAEHLDDLCAQFRAAVERQLADARQSLLQPSIAYPTQKEPS